MFADHPDGFVFPVFVSHFTKPEDQIGVALHFFFHRSKDYIEMLLRSLMESVPSVFGQFS